RPRNHHATLGLVRTRVPASHGALALLTLHGGRSAAVHGRAGHHEELRLGSVPGLARGRGARLPRLAHRGAHQDRAGGDDRRLLPERGLLVAGRNAARDRAGYGVSGRVTVHPRSMATREDWQRAAAGLAFRTEAFIDGR